jgi:hypothetical protein
VWVKSHPEALRNLIFQGSFRLFGPHEIGHNFVMPLNTRLRDLYAFPGFVPAATIRGVFGDPYAVVIPLRRRTETACGECGTMHRACYLRLKILTCTLPKR